MFGDIVMAVIGGALIGLAAVLLLAFNGRIMGVSGMLGGLLARSEGMGWRAAFLGGSIAAPLLLAVAGYRPAVEMQAGPVVLIVAGLLVGVGTSLGSGCTSGHGICGIARLSPRSLVATAVFMSVAIVTVALTRHVF